MLGSCYIHIPFCSTICSYCDFCKLLYNEKIVDKYLDSLELEIDKNYKGEVLETIYIGGGTPSALSLTQLERLFKILEKLNKSKNYEFTIEGNFESTSKEKLNLYKKYGINRLSFGIESVDEKNLDFLERVLDKERVKEIISYSKTIGLNNINVDLMYALPNEDLDILKSDLDFILSLDVPHISNYSLIIEEHTKIGINNLENISEDLDFLMYEEICKVLKNAGYEHYEISNFSKEGYYSKHNMCYWNNLEYYGFGLGASGYIGNKRYTNTRSINKYLDGDYLYHEDELSRLDKMEYEIILNLRISNGIDLERFKERYNIDFSDYCDYSDLVKNGFLIFEDEHLFIPEDKWYISNEIIVRLLEGVN